MGVSIVIELSTTSARSALAALQEVTRDLRPVLDDIGEELEKTTQERFRTNISPDGVAWPQSLHSRTTGMPTLVKSTALRDSISYRVDGNSAVEVGTPIEYGAIHQFGGTITAKGKALRFQLASGQFVTTKSVKIPARPYLGLSPADEVRIPEIVTEHWRLAAEGAP